MTNQSITSQSITPSMMALLVRVSETKNKPLFQVVDEYQKQSKIMNAEYERIRFFSEDEMDNEENIEQEKATQQENDEYNQWAEDFDNNPRGYWN